MATIKKTTTTTRSTPRTPARRKAEPSFVASTERTIKKNPYASAAVATGVISAIAAAAAGFFAFKKSGKSLSDFSGDIATSVKDKAGETASRAKELADEATTFVKDGVSEATTKAKEFADRRKDGVEPAPTFPTDPVIDSQTKTGAISY